MPPTPAPARLIARIERLFDRAAWGFLSRLAEPRPLEAPRLLEEALRGFHGRLGLYVHVPFCRKPLCRFCCFIRYPWRAEAARLYWRSVRAEIEWQASTAENARLTSIYVGGGTPSLEPEKLAELLDAAMEAWGAKPLVSVEASPRDVDDTFTENLAGRVHRVSLGAQALTNERLERLGRLNTRVEHLLAALETLRNKPLTVNVDILWGAPGETPEDTRREARRALSLEADQVTFYPLMPGSNGAPGKPPSDYPHYKAILEEAANKGYTPATPWCMTRDKTAAVDEYIVDTPWFTAAGPSGITRLPGLVTINPVKVENHAAMLEKTRGPTAAYATKPTQLEDLLYETQTSLFSLHWRPESLPNTPYTSLIRAYINATLRLLGEKPQGETWKLRQPHTLYLIHRAQHRLYTQLAKLRRKLQATETTPPPINNPPPPHS